MILASLINLSSVSNIRTENYGAAYYDGVWGVGVMFGSFTFGICLILLVLDRTKWLSSKFEFMEVWDGKLEGAFLLFMTLFWVVGVAYITQVGGLAYLSMNVYFSSWMTLAGCIYTLNEWSTNKVFWYTIRGDDSMLRDARCVVH